MPNLITHTCTRNDASFKNVMISIFDFNFRVQNLSRFCWIAPRVELSWSTWKRDMKIMVFKQCWQKTFMAFQGENIEKKKRIFLPPPKFVRPIRFSLQSKLYIPSTLNIDLILWHKTARSAQTHKSISFILIVWSTLYVYLW